MPAIAPAESGLGLVTRPDWFGDPYLVTNPPGSALSPYPVVLVMNPVLVTNKEYEAKVIALSATEVAEPSQSWMPRLMHGLRSKVDQVSHPARSSASISARTSPPDEVPSQSFSGWLQRWLLFGVVAGLLAFRLWRYFFEAEIDDDFANHCETLALAHRWVFPVYLALLVAVLVAEYLQVGNTLCSLSVLWLASSLRGYYCEAHFAGHTTAQTVHLVLRCLLIWLGWTLGPANYLGDLAVWCHGPVGAWFLLAVATALFSAFYNQPDIAEHRRALYWFATSFLVTGLLGVAAGYFFWRRCQGEPASLKFFLGAFLLLAWSPLLVYFRRWSKNVSEAFLGRMFYDFVFSENIFAEKVRKKKHLPELLLLRHWRDHGEVDKAWRTAQAHLFKEARALPVWLFAMETAVMFKRQPEEAVHILRQLCLTDAFHFDHRTVAVGQMQGWMAAAGFPFRADQFEVTRPPLQDSALSDQVLAKCRAGRFGEVENLLTNVLAEDPLNEQAFTQLVRLYCQDMKKRAAAERLIAGASETFSPTMLSHLSGLLDEWIQLPIRSTAPRKSLLDWFRRPAPAPVVSQKLSLGFPPVSRPPAPAPPADPLDAYMARVKEAHGGPADTTGAQDHIEKLLLERRLGTAIEMLKQQADAQPANFELWLRYAEAHALHCGNVTSAEKIIRQMEGSGNFKKAQMKKIHARLKKWRAKNPNFKTSW